MEQFFSRPEIQTAVLPFAIALVVYLGLRKVISTAWVWSLLAAFLASAALINGLTFTPLTGTRKIILLIVVALPVTAMLAGRNLNRNLQRGLVAAMTLLALAWVFWAVVARMSTGDIALFALAVLAMTLALIFFLDRIAANPAQLQGAGLSLMLGVGLSSIAAASALLGQLGLALASASGGAFLGWVITGSNNGQAGKESVTTLPYVIAPVLLGTAAVIFARLPWYALAALTAIPLAVGLLPLKYNSRFLRALLASLPGLLIAVAVAFWLWQSSGSDSGY